MADTATRSPSEECPISESRLLKLPRELRNMIYRHLLSQPLDSSLTYPQQLYKGCCLDFNFPLEVLLVNHQVRTEFTEEVLHQKLPVTLQVRCGEDSEHLGSTMKVRLGKLWPEVHIKFLSVEGTWSLQSPMIALASGPTDTSEAFGILRITVIIPTTTCMTRLNVTRIPEMVSEFTRVKYEITVTSQPGKTYLENSRRLEQARHSGQSRVTSVMRDRVRRRLGQFQVTLVLDTRVGRHCIEVLEADREL